jgi:hypothetical protein
MNQSTGLQRNAQGIERDQWGPFLAGFTRENRGAHARLEVLGSDVGYQVETENRPFDGVSADVKHGEDVVWIAFGSTTDDHCQGKVEMSYRQQSRNVRF